MIDENGFMADHEACLLIIGVLVDRLGGDVTITQPEVDTVAGRHLGEALLGDGQLRIAFADRVETKQ